MEEKILKQRLTKEHLELLNNNPAYGKGVYVNNSYLGIGDGDLQLRFNLPNVDLVFIKDNEDEVILKEMINPTIEEINLTLLFFNDPLPQWEQPRPKVGEVWENKLHRFHIIEGLNGTIWALILEGEDENKVFDLSMVKSNYTKLADTIEDYYK